MTPGIGSRSLNPDGTPMLDPTPWVGKVRPFLIESASQFRTDGPQALTSAAWAEDFNEVKALGSREQHDAHARADRTSRSAGRATAGRRCSGTRVRAIWSTPDYAVDIVDSALPVREDEPERRGRGDQLLERQVLLGLLATWQAIHEANRDGNPATRARPCRGRRSSPRPTPSTRPGTSPRRRAPARAADVLRHGPDRVRRDEQLASRVRRDHFDRFSHLSRRSSTPASGRASTTAPPTCQARPRQEGRELRPQARLPTCRVTTFRRTWGRTRVPTEGSTVC